MTALLASALTVAGCGQDCCTVDSLPIPLDRAPLGGGDTTASGALLARAMSPSVNGGTSFPMVLDTGSPFTVLSGSGGGGAGLQALQRSFDLLDASQPPDIVVLRAEFRDITLLDLMLGPVGAASTQPLGVFGGDLLRAFSVELRLGGPCPSVAGALATNCPSVTFWRRQGANQGFLEDAGFAVLHFSLFGGGEVTASGDPDIFGTRAPLQLPPTRIVLRGCASPRTFDPKEPPDLDVCCNRGDEVTISTGVDLSLLVATGVGPLVLSESAWARISQYMTAHNMFVAPSHSSDAMQLATWGAVNVLQWTSIPRLALVDLEVGANDDPGPCVEFGRARRIEWMSYQRFSNADPNACVWPCDTDPRQPDLAQNSAAYLEIGGAVPVAVVPDEEPFLQSLRADVRPEGPEIDGVAGAAALGYARIEIDYLSSPTRALFSCEEGADRDACWAAARCPRLADHTTTHFCFGLGPQMLPDVCSTAPGCE
jgi:hypothetical protein